MLLIVCEHILAHPLPHKEWPLQLTPTISGDGEVAAASEPGGTATTTLSLAIAALSPLICT